MYSKPRDFSTSTMKSEPGRSAVRTSAADPTGPVSSASAFADGTVTARRVAGSCASMGVLPAASAAAPAAAPFRKPRRASDFPDFRMTLISFLAERQFSLAFFFVLDARPEQLLEKAFAHQAVHRAVIDYRSKIEALHQRRRLLVERMLDHVPDGSRQHVRHSFESIGLGVPVINPRQIVQVLGRVLHVSLQREVFVFIETFDGFAMSL